MDQQAFCHLVICWQLKILFQHQILKCACIWARTLTTSGSGPMDSVQLIVSGLFVNLKIRVYFLFYYVGHSNAGYAPEKKCKALCMLRVNESSGNIWRMSNFLIGSISCFLVKPWCSTVQWLAFDILGFWIFLVFTWQICGLKCWMTLLNFFRGLVRLSKPVSHINDSTSFSRPSLLQLLIP